MLLVLAVAAELKCPMLLISYTATTLQCCENPRATSKTRQASTESLWLKT
jgi:hypothetical protein